jgi:hypothetical protein
MSSKVASSSSSSSAVEQHKQKQKRRQKKRHAMGPFLFRVAKDAFAEKGVPKMRLKASTLDDAERLYDQLLQRMSRQYAKQLRLFKRSTVNMKMVEATAALLFPSSVCRDMMADTNQALIKLDRSLGVATPASKASKTTSPSSKGKSQASVTKASVSETAATQDVE